MKHFQNNIDNVIVNVLPFPVLGNMHVLNSGRTWIGRY